MTKMRQPPKGEVWLHVDRLDKKNEAVWAVQYWADGKPVYRVTRSVTVDTLGFTRFFGPRSRQQPRAVVVFDGAIVTLTRAGVYIGR